MPRKRVSSFIGETFQPIEARDRAIRFIHGGFYAGLVFACMLLLASTIQYSQDFVYPSIEPKHLIGLFLYTALILFLCFRIRRAHGQISAILLIILYTQDFVSSLFNYFSQPESGPVYGIFGLLFLIRIILLLFLYRAVRGCSYLKKLDQT